MMATPATALVTSHPPPLSPPPPATEKKLQSEARVLCKGAASALSTAIFWRAMTVDLDTDEGERRRRSPDPESTATTTGTGSELPGATGARPVKKAAGYSHPTPPAPPADRGRSRGKAARIRSNAECLGRPVGMSGSRLGHRGGGTRGDDVKNGDNSTSSTGTRKRSRDAVGRGVGGGTPGREAGDRNTPGSGRQFLRRYHHHVAFRRLVRRLAQVGLRGTVGGRDVRYSRGVLLYTAYRIPDVRALLVFRGRLVV